MDVGPTARTARGSLGAVATEPSGEASTSYGAGLVARRAAQRAEAAEPSGTSTSGREGLLGSAADVLSRLRALAVQSGNDALSDTQRTAMQQEVHLLTERLKVLTLTTSLPAPAPTAQEDAAGADATKADATKAASSGAGTDGTGADEAGSADGRSPGTASPAAYTLGLLARGGWSGASADTGSWTASRVGAYQRWQQTTGGLVRLTA